MPCTSCEEAHYGEPTLWFEETVFADGVAASQAASWTLPFEKYLQVRNASVAYLTVQWNAVGAGAATTSLQFQRSSIATDYSDAFENIGLDIDFTRTSGVSRVILGQDNASYAHGLLRFQVSNTGVNENWCMLRLRIWVTLQPA